MARSARRHAGEPSRLFGASSPAANGHVKDRPRLPTVHCARAHTARPAPDERQARTDGHPAAGDSALHGALDMPTPAFSFIKTTVQTRARAHTAKGHVCYVFGEKGTSSLETPVRNHRAKDPRERRRVIRMDPPRHYDYRNRNDVATKGYAAPQGAAAEWRDGHEWVRRIEAADGKRTDSRQLRDDIVGIPLALVEQGTAEQALQDDAQELARVHRTPVHYAIHSPHKGSRNWHGHVLYAGRRLTADGRAFERRRDRSQDRPELIERNKAIWTEVCRRYGLELDFTPQHPEQAPAPEHRLTARAIATERRAAAREEGIRLSAALEAAGGAPLPPQEQQAIGGTSLDLDGLDTAGLLALPRTPVTTAARIAKHARQSIPATAPAAEAPRPRPTPAPAIDVADLEVSPMFVPRPGQEVHVPRARPEAAPAVDPGMAPSLPRPLAPEPVAVPRSRPAPLPPVAIQRPRPEPAPAMTPQRTRPVPAASVVAPEMRHERPAPAPACRPAPPGVPGPSSHPAGGFRPIGPVPAPAAPWVPVRARPRAARAVEAPAPALARPVPALAIGVPAPVPPWRAVRKWLRRMKTWWPWAGRPPRPEKAVRVEPPPLDLARPRPARCIDPPRKRPPAPAPAVLVFKPDTRGAAHRCAVASPRARAASARTTRPAPAPTPPASTHSDWDFWH